jgi:serine/threonine protein kinase/Flp pilus assembly protein TadD
MKIRCPKCLSENTEDSHFCKNCATPLPPREDISVSDTKTLETPVESLARGTTFAVRYEIIEELGKGGMGKVYRVLDKKIEEEVALKLLNPEIASDQKIIDRFKNELKFARKIRHKNVCQMFDLGEAEGTHYITMEYVPGEDLRSFIRRSRQLTVGTAVIIARQVCEGLSEAHRQGVVHRDLKPGNVMIDKEGNARIMDFGIARSTEAKGITRIGVMIGTPEYMSPEQVEGKETDHRSDIYSLGVILFEMLTGRLPFEGETPLSVALKHKSEMPKDPRELDPQIPMNLSLLILKCMEKEKEKRYQNADELLLELRNIEKGLPTAEKEGPKRKPIAEKEITVKFRLKRLFIPALALIALTIIALTTWQFLPQKEIVPITSDKPSLAVMYFKNNTGDENLDHWRAALSDLLITDLSQSKYLRVLSGERLFNILGQLQQLEARTYSSGALKEVAKRGGVESIVVGNFARADGIFRINITLQDAFTGELIGSESVEGIGEKNFFQMVDELTRKIKASFKFSEKQIASDLDEEVGKITTNSPEAYKYYVEGIKHNSRGDYQKSISSLKKALDTDPEFAMAYRAMSVSYHNMRLYQEQRKAIQKAIELSFRVSDRERFLIQGEFYRSSEKTYDKAIETYKELLALYPEDATPRTNLGWLSLTLEEWDEAIQLFNAIIQSKYESAIPYWNLAEAYMAKGVYVKARQVLESCLNKYPLNAYTYRLLIFTYICQRKYELALAEVDKALSIDLEIDQHELKGNIYLLRGDLTEAEMEYLELPGGSHRQRLSLSDLYLLKGRLKKAKDLLKQSPDLSESLAYLNLKHGNPKEALQEYTKMVSDAIEDENLFGQIRALHLKGLTYVALNSIEEAQNTASELKELVQKSPYRKALRFYQHLMGGIELERGNFPQTVEYLNKAVSLISHQRHLNYKEQAPIIDSLAYAYYKAGDMENARDAYERIISLTMGRLYYGDVYAKSFYMMGKIYEQQANKSKAIEYYERFLDLWKDADSGISEVEDARISLKGLKSQ